MQIVDENISTNMFKNTILEKYRLDKYDFYDNLGINKKGGYISQQSREKARKRHKRK